MSRVLADKGYLALRVQADADTPIKPNSFFGLVSEGIKINPAYEADRRLKGLDWKSDDLLRGETKVEGPLSVLADPEALGHILNMCYSKTSTSGDATDGYTHVFDPGEGKSYSLDIPRGDYGLRIWGVRGDNLNLSFQNNRLVASLNIKALGQFFSASLAAALTGAGMTSLTLSTESDPRPAEGLAAGDVLIIGSTEVTITTVSADGKTVNFSSTSITASVGDPVYLKAQTPSLGTQRNPFYLTNALVGFGDDETEATTAAGTKSTASFCYDIVLNLLNNLFDAQASGKKVLLNQVKEANFQVARFFETPIEYQKWIERIKEAATIIITGQPIKSDLSTSEKLMIKLHKIKAMTNDNPLDSGQYIFDRQNFEVLYDSVDGASVGITIVNRTAGTSY